MTNVSSNQIWKTLSFDWLKEHYVRQGNAILRKLLDVYPTDEKAK